MCKDWEPVVFSELTINDLTLHHSDILTLQIEESCRLCNAGLPLCPTQDKHKEVLEMVGRLRHTLYRDLFPYEEEFPELSNERNPK